MISYGTIKDGKLRLNDREKFEEALSEMKDCRVQLVLHPVAGAVSTKLRKYYWALCRLIADYLRDCGHAGVKAEEIHERNKQKYMVHSDMNYATGEIHKQTLSHVDLSNKQMLRICHSMQQEWAERGLYLPDPNEELKTNIHAEKDIRDSTVSETPDGPQ